LSSFYFTFLYFFFYFTYSTLLAVDSTDSRLDAPPPAFATSYLSVLYYELICFDLLYLLYFYCLAQFIEQGLDLTRVPAFGTSYRTMLGSIIFNYAFIVMVPSWINEKRAEVSVNRSHFTLLYFVTLLYSAWRKAR